MKKGDVIQITKSITGRAGKYLGERKIPKGTQLQIIDIGSYEVILKSLYGNVRYVVSKYLLKGNYKLT